jgi:hypothetical protein
MHRLRFWFLIVYIIGLFGVISLVPPTKEEQYASMTTGYSATEYASTADGYSPPVIDYEHHRDNTGADIFAMFGIFIVVAIFIKGISR